MTIPSERAPRKRKAWVVDHAARQGTADAADLLERDVARLTAQWHQMSEAWQRSDRGKVVAEWIREVEDFAATIRETSKELARPMSIAEYDKYL